MKFSCHLLMHMGLERARHARDCWSHFHAKASALRAKRNNVGGPLFFREYHRSGECRKTCQLRGGAMTGPNIDVCADREKMQVLEEV